MPTATPFSNLITFSRGSNATVTGSNGLIQWAPNNLLTFSEQFDNAAWSKSNVTVTANSAVAPDGTITADKLVANASNTTKFALGSPNVTFSAGQGATHSCYVKADGYSKIALRESATTGAYASFDLATATVIETGNAGGVVVSNAAITAVGNGWYRIAITCTNASASATNGFGAWLLSPSYTTGQPSGQTWVGDGTSGFFIWGAQLELGSTATTYNPTTVKNLLGFSEAFDNAAWTKSNSSIVTGAQANPVNNLFNAQKLMENTGAATQHYVAQILTTLNAGKPITLSVYAKAGERRYIALLEGFSNKGQYFDLQTGTVGSVLIGAPTSASITAVGNGWYRCSMTTPVLSTTASLEVYLSNSGASISYTGDGNSGVYIYGAQLSDSASLDPYVPTPGAAPSSTAFYGPRFDFDPVTLQPRGLLVEEQRTNLALRSDDFANASWVKSDVNVTANSAVAPDGTTTADLLIPTAVNTVHTVVQTITTPASSMVLSFYAKPSGYNFIQVHDGTSGTDYINFDLSTGVVGNLSGYTGAITAVGSGWYRCTAIKTFTAAAHEFRLNPLDANTASRRPSFAGNGTSGVLVWGAQLEAGAFATSYIPTVASTVTRSADVATITGQNFAQWFANSEGTFALEANMFSVNTGDRRIIGINNIPAAAAFVSSGAGLGIFDGTIVAASGAVIANTPFKGATAFDSTTKYAVRNGGVVANGARSVTFPITPGSSIQLGFEGGGGNYLNGHIRNIRFIPARAADFQLQALST